MNPDTLVAVCCYAGDADLVQQTLPIHQAHECPVLILSPADSPVILPTAFSMQFGKRAYIGEASLQRQLRYLEHLLTWPQRYFLINDADSFCASARLPEQLREVDENVGTIVWSNEIAESRPHPSPYPKIAMQPPYFLHRDAISKMLRVAHNVPAHPITPYVDWFMLALACEAGISHRSFAELENGPEKPFSDSWEHLDYRIRYRGTIFCHPIKTEAQIKLCVDARKFYEKNYVS